MVDFLACVTVIDIPRYCTAIPKKPRELLKKWPRSRKKRIGSGKNLGPIMTVSPLAKIGVNSIRLSCCKST